MTLEVDLSNVSRRCTLIFAGGDEYEVLDENVHFVVNLQRRTCTLCGK